MRPRHGFINCTACRDLFSRHERHGDFEMWGEGEPIRLINNPASWGTSDPQILLLGFSKGNTQNREMALVKSAGARIEDVPFKGMRKRLDWLLVALNLKSRTGDVNEIFQASEGHIQSGSLIRCSISAQKPGGGYSYKLKDILAMDGSSGGRVKQVMSRCASVHLKDLKVGSCVVVLGLDKELIASCKALFRRMYGDFERETPTTYRTSGLTWVHVAHPSGSQTDPQYMRWCRGETSTAKVTIARDELRDRLSR